MTSTNRLFSLALDAPAELKAEVETPLPQLVPAAPALPSILSELGALPREALFLGMASDGLPILLNLHDPVPGPVLLVGDGGAGKTAFLKNVAHAVALTHKPAEVKFGVITSHVDEWDEVRNTSHCAGIFSSSDVSGQDHLTSTALWAHENTRAGQSMLLFIDDLEAAAAFDLNALQALRWLLARGSSRRVWLFVTLNAPRYGQVISWIPNFRTRIFGQIRDARVARALGGDSAGALDSLRGGVQFALRENGNWLRFWLPSS